ncbi:NADH dehydrogenase [ubiquinone] 1 alpha subcomplex subunit 7-like [Cylas formicarius]|uniref:NADH dehydrogenase [ubiquinone] 1 alpha subcomplex subunit 7-like n=1 Tax=Cylas formicarius TaxID=197179 RepID=UPI0029584A32|nr:NADH dehydrogenase [ubiquinone] 1 alpha subcomplex subunit 7-like [Cylas formicarius]
MPPRPKIQHHDVSPFLQNLREILLGRKHTKALRFQDLLSTRDPPPPVLPDGPAHRLNNNYYFTRDPRREVTPPEVIVPSPKQIQERGEGRTLITPGKLWNWD